MPLPEKGQPIAIAISFAFAIRVGVGFGLFPAMKVSIMDPAEPCALNKSIRFMKFLQIFMKKRLMPSMAIACL